MMSPTNVRNSAPYRRTVEGCRGARGVRQGKAEHLQNRTHRVGPVGRTSSIFSGPRRYERIKTHVYIPPQAPGPGHACRTTSRRCSSVILPTANAPFEKKVRQHSQKICIAILVATTLRLTVRFKRVRDIDGVALLVSHRRAIDVPLADLYRAAVHDDRRAVVSHRGHGTARHVLVASGQGYVTIVVLGLANKTQNDEKRQRLPEAQVTLLIVVPL